VLNSNLVPDVRVLVIIGVGVCSNCSKSDILVIIGLGVCSKSKTVNIFNEMKAKYAKVSLFFSLFYF
jgi:hypothetical protein